PSSDARTLPSASSRTEHSISRTEGTHCSIRIFLSKPNASLHAVANSSAVPALETPTDEPILAGFTKSSELPTLLAASAYVIGNAADIERKGTIGRAASRIKRLATSLSIAAADPMKPEPR